MSAPLRKTDAETTKRRKSASLSKSRFCTGVQCLKALYFKVHEPDLGAPTDAAQQMIFDQGTAVGVEARKRYPNGVLIDQDHFHSKEALAATSAAIENDSSAIFEAALFYNNTLVRIDVLKNNGDGTWDIIEVKSTTKLKEEHLPDLAIQRYIAEGSGVRIARTFLKHLNRECICPNLENLFVDENCTGKVSEMLPTISGLIDQMLATLESSSAPKIDIGPHCDAPYECAFKDQCWSHIPEHSVFELNGVWSTTKFDLYGKGFLRIKDIPKTEKVSRAKAQQLKAVREQTPVIDVNGLTAFIEQLKYPLYFFDFETMNLAIPQLPGLSPYAHYPFQFSCHVIENDGAELKHIEFLADGAGDPRAEITKQLVSALGAHGTILAYNDAFEKARIKELANQLPSQQNNLLDLLPRFIDLKEAFSKYYYHPDFHGSLSIKDVLPVIVPNMTYEGMDVADGGGAQVAYSKLCDPNLSLNERQVLRQGLLEYCKQDTLAMVELLRQVIALVKKQR